MRIEAVDEEFFTWLAHGDFAFEVAQVFEPAFGVRVEDCLRPVPAYRKDYDRDSKAFRMVRDAADRALLAVRDAEGWAGYLLLGEHWNGYACVEDLGVEARHRRRGVAQRLMEAAVTWARQRGLAGLMLETQDTNVPACRFYQHVGFELGGIDRLLYSAQDGLQGETALFWYLRFQDAGPAQVS